MKNDRSILRPILLVAFLLASAAAVAQTAVTPSIEGILYAETAFGQPGYGENPETDSIDFYYVIRFSRSVSLTVRTAEGGTVRLQTTRVQIFPTGDFNARLLVPLQGRRIRITGRLFRGFSERHRTDALVEVGSITQIVELN